MGLIASVRAWVTRRRDNRERLVFRRSPTNLDGIMRPKRIARDPGGSPRTRLHTASYDRLNWVDWPNEPPSTWRDTHPEEYWNR